MCCILQRFEDLLNLHMWRVANFVGIQVPKEQIKNDVGKSTFFLSETRIYRSLPVKMTHNGHGKGDGSPDWSLKLWYIIF